MSFKIIMLAWFSAMKRHEVEDRVSKFVDVHSDLMLGASVVTYKLPVWGTDRVDDIMQVSMAFKKPMSVEALRKTLADRTGCEVEHYYSDHEDSCTWKFENEEKALPIGFIEHRVLFYKKPQDIYE